MAGAYSTFDTLSLQWSESGPADPAPAQPTLPVLARIPRVTPAEPPRINQINTAHTTATSPKTPVVDLASTVFEVRPDSAQAIPLTSITTAPVESVIAAAPIITRIDNPEVSPLTEPAPAVKQEAEKAIVDEAAAPTAPQAQVVAAVEFDEPEGLIGLLLKIESVVAPYSQIIVLLTLLAAAALTVVLLQGKPPRIDDSLQSAEATAAATAAATSDQPTVIPAPEPVVEQAVARVQGPIGVGPQGKPRGVITGVGPIEPHREPGGQPLRVAQNPRPAGAESTAPSSPNEQPVPRLSRILPYDGQTR